MNANWKSIEDSAAGMLMVLIISSTCVWSATALINLIWRRASAAIRHRLWGVSMLSVLVTPILCLTLPTGAWTPTLQLNDWFPAASVKLHTDKKLRLFDSPVKVDVALSAPRDASSNSEGVGRVLDPNTSSASNSPSRAKTSFELESQSTGHDLTTAVGGKTSTSNFPSFELPAWDTFRTVIVEIWLAGLMIQAVVFAMALARTSNAVRRSVHLNTGREHDLCESLRKQFVIAVPVRTVISQDAPVPYITGCLRPVIVLPPGVAHWSNSRLEIVLSHELMHAKRNDIFWQVISQICLILVWFHPFGWIVNWRLRVECEHACDDAVLTSGSMPCEYAEHLVSLASEMAVKRQIFSPSTVAVIRQSLVERRVRSILNPTIRREPVGMIRSVCLTIGSGVAVLLLVLIAPRFSESNQASEVPAPVHAPEVPVLVPAAKNDKPAENAQQKVEKESPPGESGQSKPAPVEPTSNAQNDQKGETKKKAPAISLPARPYVSYPIQIYGSSYPVQPYGSTNSSNQPALAERETAEVRAVRQALPSVGNIHTERAPLPADGPHQNKTINGLGTGLVIDERGYLLTVLHVVKNVDKIRVQFQGEKLATTTYDARLIASSEKDDLAIIKIDRPEKFQVAPWGVSSDVMLAERVIAIGNSFGYDGTVTFGNVSGLGRNIEANELVNYRNLIQTDVAINPGNSGGPLINIRGEVIGIAIAIRANSQKIGFAMPIDDVRKAAERMIASVAQLDNFEDVIDRAIQVTSTRRLSIESSPVIHSPWQIFHAINATRRQCRLKRGSDTVNAIEWISTSEPTFNNEPWMLLTRHGAKFHPYSKTYFFEGHPGQFLALLTNSDLSFEHEFRVQGKTVKLTSFVENLKQEVNTHEEVSWVLWALQHYLPPDAEWLNQQGEQWSIERLVKMEASSPIVGAPDGGNPRLIALTRARNKYLKSGGKLRGVWLEADQKINQHTEIARRLQNADGSFSSDWYQQSMHTSDVNHRFNTTGKTLEFLSIALPQDRLNEPWIKKAVMVLGNELIQHATTPVDVAALFHSLNALVEYRNRTRPIQPAISQLVSFYIGADR